MWWREEIVSYVPVLPWRCRVTFPTRCSCGRGPHRRLPAGAYVATAANAAPLADAAVAVVVSVVAEVVSRLREATSVICTARRNQLF